MARRKKVEPSGLKAVPSGEKRFVNVGGLPINSWTCDNCGSVLYNHEQGHAAGKRLNEQAVRHQCDGE